MLLLTCNERLVNKHGLLTRNVREMPQAFAWAHDLRSGLDMLNRYQNALTFSLGSENTVMEYRLVSVQHIDEPLDEAMKAALAAVHVEILDEALIERFTEQAADSGD